MAPKLFRKMKRVDFSCASPGSAALCMSSTERGSTSMSCSGRAIDRSTSQLIDSRRASKPKPYNQKSRKNPEEPADLISPASSSRYLLDDDTTFLDVFRDLEPLSQPVTIELPRFQPLKGDASAGLRPASPENQVVILRVSLHCKACEGKVKKHISKMEGVTSFSVDLATKKVTVRGNVTPLGVLNSISKVKNAQFWPSLRPS